MAVKAAKKEERSCFVVGPIGEARSEVRNHADWLLRGIIEPVFKEHFPDTLVERADRITAPGMIDSQVITRLMEAFLVIADMSFENANAFYEMGIRHVKQLRIIHMYREGSSIPFDVKLYRAIPFNYANPEDLVRAQQALKPVVDEVIKPDYVVDNPVTRVRGLERLEEHATDTEQLLLEQIRSLSERVRYLELVTHNTPSVISQLRPVTTSSLASDILRNTITLHSSELAQTPTAIAALKALNTPEVKAAIAAANSLEAQAARVAAKITAEALKPRKK